MPLQEAISSFGREAKSKLANPSATGSPEDQLRAPLDALFLNLAALCGLSPSDVVAVGETSLADIKTRPDFALTLKNALMGFVEVKAPGKGADPRRFHDKHDKDQWEKLQTLPNLIYTDGNEFGLWRDGKLTGNIVCLEGDIATSGSKLASPCSLVPLFADFFQWQPQPPRSVAQLAEVTARLCRLLREEVAEQLGRGSYSLTNLAKDWRKLLFPSATDDAFADGYAQAVTFGLLMARARNIPLAGGLDRVALELRRTNTLIGAALRLLTDDADDEKALKTSLATLSRVLDVVDWPAVSKSDPEAWLYFYEHFLSVYDNELRKKTGSYYTPPEVVRAMVRLVDDALRSNRRFALWEGLASPDVTVADPATGTGTFLLGILRRIAETTKEDQGPGAVPGVVEAAVSRLIGFEIQFGPFAVAQLRILAELQSLLENPKAAPAMRLYVTDTLGNPYAEENYLPQILKPIGESRRQANEIKRQEKITVVIGNPPYKEKAKGLGGWIESGIIGDEAMAPLLEWMPPTDWNVGLHAKHLRNLYVYFWRWATWKVFGDGEPNKIKSRKPDRKGIVCFISGAGFLNGPGFQKMRADLRRDADEIWVIDCSPEGHQPGVSTRIFQGVQQPICIVMALRITEQGSPAPARVRYRVLPEGNRNHKFEALAAISLEDDEWTDCPSDPRSSFLPKATGQWARYLPLADLFNYDGSGVMPGRTWVISPDRASLERRWHVLQSETDPETKQSLFHPHLRGGKPGDKHVNKPLRQGLYGHEYRSLSVASDTAPLIRPVRYAFRSFDRQWIIPDGRLINRPNPTLWANHSAQQVYMTAQHQPPVTSGPAVTFSASMPDLNHYSGRGGRVFPLWADRKAQQPNIKVAFLQELANSLGIKISAQDVMAYFAAVAAHPAYSARFQPNLVQPGLRFPMTGDASLFREAISIGSEVIWLHCFGDRFSDPSAGRPKRAPRMSADERPVIPKGGGISTDPARFPNNIKYEAAARKLHIGQGFVNNVPLKVWEYEVSGKQVLNQWFSYRRLDRSRPIIGTRRPPSRLTGIQPNGWLAEYTTELMNLLHVLARLVKLEPQQADLLDRICAGPQLNVDNLGARGASVATASRRPTQGDERQGDWLNHPEG